MVLCRRGTSNSRFTAQVVAVVTGEQIVSLADRIKGGSTEELNSENRYVVVCPIYAWRIPRVVAKHLREITPSGNRKAYFIVTACGSSGNAAHSAERLGVELGLGFMGLATLYMPGTDIALMQNPQQDDTKARLRAAVPQSRTLTAQILSGQEFAQEKTSCLGKFMSRAVNPAFYRNVTGQ